MQRRLVSSLAATIVALALVAGCSSSDRPSLVDDASGPGTTVASGCDPALADYANHVAYAKNDGKLAVYANPGDAAPSQTFDSPRKTDTDPPVDVPLVFLAVNEPADNCAWVQVLLPIRPNGSTGWVKRSDVKMEGNNYRIEVNLSAFNLKAYVGDKVILDVPVGVARDNTPTPGGLYYTTELLTPPNPDGVYGTHAFGLSGFSDQLTSFNGGQGQLGIHGTNDDSTIGTQVSHGCIRLHNADINSLVDQLKTYYGIPVQVNA